MSKYAIPVNDHTLDLIQVLNGGLRPLIEEQKTYFTFETDGPTDTTNHNIVFQENLYDGKIGHVGNGYVIQMVQ